MAGQFFNQFKDKIRIMQDRTADKETPVKILLCHKNIWGSDNFVNALKDRNSISSRYWIECIEIVQFGRAVLDAIIKESYDVIIIDNELEHWGPVETVQKIREVDPRSKVIISTTVITPEILKLKDEGKINMILTVPFQTVPMWQQLDELLNK